MVRVASTGGAVGACRESTGGFSLVEVLVSMLILTGGLLSLAALMAVGVQTAASSSPALIAREKAREAVESVHSARDTGELAWNRVRNEAQGGDFLDGAQDIREPGPDGLVNTADDGDIEVLREPGADGVIDTDDDRLTPLRPELFQREIAITPTNIDGSENENPNLRLITVTVRYRVNGGWRTYSLTTFVSAYS
jgi:hypothetical protein